MTITADSDCDRQQMLDLLQGIRADGQTRVPIREGALSLDVALAANHSAELGAEARLDG